MMLPGGCGCNYRQAYSRSYDRWQGQSHESAAYLGPKTTGRPQIPTPIPQASQVPTPISQASQDALTRAWQRGKAATADKLEKMEHDIQATKEYVDRISTLLNEIRRERDQTQLETATTKSNVDDLKKSCRRPEKSG